MRLVSRVVRAVSQEYIHFAYSLESIYSVYQDAEYGGLRGLTESCEGEIERNNGQFTSNLHDILLTAVSFFV